MQTVAVPAENSTMRGNLGNETSDLTNLTLQQLREITDNFKEKIGHGGYGVVYKGLYKTKEIAVKVFHDNCNPETKYEDFKREFSNLQRLNHENIIQLIGSCYETWEEAAEYKGRKVFADRTHASLCLEYMHNGNLGDYLPADEPIALDWCACHKIIHGTCEGLRYLHEGSDQHIYHLDLKPANILLDQNMIPKLADFGLSRFFNEEQTRNTQELKGTRGYMPPEYIDGGKYSKKFDIFSLGAVMMKIVAAPKGITDSKKMGNIKFIEHVCENWKKRLLDSGYSPPEVEAYCKQVETCVEVALDCVEDEREKRPSIVEIVNRLNGKVTRTSTKLLTAMDGLTLQPVSDSHEDTTANIGFPKTTAQTIRMLDNDRMVSMDVHPTEPWVLTSHSKGHIRIWNYQTNVAVMSHEVTKGKEVLTAKFIAQKQWIVAGGGDSKHGCIYVYSYTKLLDKFTSNNTVEEVKIINALTQKVTSLAIHPTNTYILAASYDFALELRDWDNDWKCAKKFKGGHSSSVRQAVFNPKDANVFASASKDKTIKIWSIICGDSVSRLEGHSSDVRCLDYITNGDNQYLITGSEDGTAKIWDLQENKCVHTLEKHSKRVTTVCSHPELPVLMTGSLDGTVHRWNSKTFRHKGELNFGLGEVYGLGCIKGSKRIVIGHRHVLKIVDVDHEGDVSSSNQDAT